MSLPDVNRGERDGLSRAGPVPNLASGALDRSRIELYIARAWDKHDGSAAAVKEKVLGIISWIVFGLIAGIIAKLIMPGRDPGGCIITILLGIAGAFVGGFLYRLLTGREVFFQFDLGSFVVAVLGALVILAVYRLIAGRQA